jgi:hypothetical protein
MVTPTGTGGFHLKPWPKQWDFINCAADTVVFGGSAGGGKSRAILSDPICRWRFTIPGYTKVVFRREGKQITDPGGLWDKAMEIYPWFGGVPHVQDREFRWPWGAKIAFRHVENEADKHKFAGAEFCDLDFDELYHFTESQYLFLTSRNRSTCGLLPQIRCTTNPDPGWVRRLIAPWVDDEWQGQRASSGEILWQLRNDKGDIEWVPEGTPFAKSITFIRSELKDNPSLYVDQPDYEATLRNLPPIERARLLYGDWSVRAEGLVYPEALDPSYGVLVEGVPERSRDQARVGGMDFGVHNPFVALAGHIDYDDVLWITYCRYVRGLTIPVHAKAIPKGIRWWCDPAGAQERLQLRAGGHDVVPCVHIPTRGAGGETKPPRRSGIDMVRHRMRTGRLKIVRGACRDLVRELGLYVRDINKPDEEEPIKRDDHAPDALRYLVVGHDRNRYVESGEPQETDEQMAEREQAESESRAMQALEVAASRDWNDPQLWGN